MNGKKTEENINVKKEQLSSLKKIEREVNKQENEENNVHEDEEKYLFLSDNLDWKEYHEKILVDWADKALCYRWLHSRSCSKYVVVFFRCVLVNSIK